MSSSVFLSMLNSGSGEVSYTPAEMTYPGGKSLSFHEVADAVDDDAFGDSGNAFYLLDGTVIYTYDLSTPYDLTDAVYNSSKTLATSGGIGLSLKAIRFKTDGTELYLLASDDEVYTYSLSTAWDPSSGTIVAGSVSLGPTYDFYIRDNGIDVYAVNFGDDAIKKYTLPTAWDFSGGSITRVAADDFDTSAFDTGIICLDFKDDGTEVYLGDNTARRIFTVELTTAWDVSTGTENSSKRFDIPLLNSILMPPFSLLFNPNGEEFYILQNKFDADIANHFTMSTNWDVSTASNSNPRNYNMESFDDATTQMYFKDDGVTFFTVDTTNNKVRTFETDVEWNPLYATRNSSKELSSIPPARGIAFKDDGTKMFISEVASGNLDRYSLSTAWDPSTASLDLGKSFDLNADPNIHQQYNITFNSDGTILYVVDNGTTHKVVAYNLSTAWDVSTAVYDVSLDVNTVLDTAFYGIWMSPDDLTLILTGINSGMSYIAKYDLTVEGDISTATHDAAGSLDIETYAAVPVNASFSPDGEYMFFSDRLVEVIRGFIK